MPRLLSVFVLILLAVTPAQADPDAWRAEGWAKTDFRKTSIAWSEILSGGPPKDGIPAIDAPQFRPVGEIADIAPAEPVMTVIAGEEARAYPLRVLIWHEIVNDTIAGRPVAVTYCPLCNSALVFDRTVGGRVLDFGTTGKLRNSDLVMYDRQTESWWQQFTGEAIVGELLGTRLDLVPARLESFADFKGRHPQGSVLVPNDPAARRYGMNPYAGYDTSTTPFLYRGALPTGIEPLARVVVVRADRDEPVVVALAHLREKGELMLGDIRLTWRKGQVSAVDERIIAESRDVGSVEAFRIGAGAPEPLPYDVTFAFVAHAFHPQVPIIGK